MRIQEIEALITTIKEAIKFQEYAFGQLQKVLLALMEEERIRYTVLLQNVMKKDGDEN